ncbi:UDP-N-acetylglucosamine 1-carboxyvinyltransferase [Spirochaetota bacterium]|nr:UDP-N-acetylglucosamine 1-carboxyvinyltransferase [Spirochaetota bacterium]
MLRKYTIKGGPALQGTVCTAGSKNAALPIFAATLLTEEEVILHNVPVLRDTDTMIRLLERLGKRIVRVGTTVTISAADVPIKQPVQATYEVVKQMRASICVLGPLLARYGHVEVALPGGCVFGPRPVDLHLKGLAQLGADINIQHGDIMATARSKTLVGARVDLLGKFGTSVLATDNVLSAAVLAKGKTIINHAAQEPETVDLIHFLQALGATIHCPKQKGYATIEIEGVDRLHGTEYTIIPDRIEACTYMIFAAMTGGKITLTHVQADHLSAPITLLRNIGFEVTVSKGNSHRGTYLGQSIVFQSTPLHQCDPFTLTTGTYPNFPTDMQPLFMALATMVPGCSVIYESIYPNRFNHAPELARMGAAIVIEGNSARITGVHSLQGARVQASDLRAGAALVGAALSAEGESAIKRIYHIERGYEGLVTKLSSLGALINVDEDPIL